MDPALSYHQQLEGEGAVGTPVALREGSPDGRHTLRDDAMLSVASLNDSTGLGGGGGVCGPLVSAVSMATCESGGATSADGDMPPPRHTASASGWEDALVRNKARLDTLLAKTAHTPSVSLMMPSSSSSAASSSSPATAPLCSDASAQPGGAQPPASAGLLSQGSAAKQDAQPATPRSPLTPLELSAIGPLESLAQGGAALPAAAKQRHHHHMQPLELQVPAAFATSGLKALTGVSAEDLHRRVAAFERERAMFEAESRMLRLAHIERGYSACLEMNKVLLSDSLAMKRQVWLDSSAQMWQRTAQQQSDDALQTAKALKQKEEEFRQHALSQERIEKVQHELKVCDDTLQAKTTALERLDTELEKRRSEMAFLEGTVRQAEADTMSTALFFRTEDLKAREEAVAQREAATHAATLHATDLAAKESVLAADVVRLEALEHNLASKERGLVEAEEQLSAQGREYYNNRERLLFEYADLAEREAAIEEKQKAAKDAWNSACAQQAEASVLCGTLAQLSQRSTDHLAGLGGTFVLHASAVAGAFHQALSGAVSYDHFVRQRAVSRVIPAPSASPSPYEGLCSVARSVPTPSSAVPAGLPHGAGLGAYFTSAPVCREGSTGGGGGPAWDRGASAANTSGVCGGVSTVAGGHGGGVPAVPSVTTPRAAAWADSRGGPGPAVRTGVMSPSVKPRDADHADMSYQRSSVYYPPQAATTPTAGRGEPQQPRQSSLDSIEKSLRERYGSAPPRHEPQPQPQAQAQAQPPPQPSCAGTTPHQAGTHRAEPRASADAHQPSTLSERLRDRLREENSRFSYESRLKELLRERGMPADAAARETVSLPRPAPSADAAVSMPEDWRGGTPTSGGGGSAPVSPRLGVSYALRGSQPTTPRLPAPYRDLTSPRAGAAAAPAGAPAAHPGRHHAAPGNMSVDTVFKQIREMEDFLSHVTSRDPVRDSGLSEAP